MNNTYMDGIYMHIQQFYAFQCMDFHQMILELVKNCNVVSFGMLRLPFVAMNTV